MFFILSKILLFLLNPFNWILVCIVAAFFIKKQLIKKRLLIAAVVLFVIFSNNALYMVAMRKWQPKAVQPSYNKTYSTAILLCGMTKSDSNQVSYFSNTSDRFLQTARLYTTGVVKHIFISGGDGSLAQDHPKEAVFLREEFIALGIPDSAIVIESNSRNTYESAVEAKKIIDSIHLEPPFILVTSAVHMPRSVLTFKKAELDVIPHPAAFDVVNRKWEFGDFMPNIAVLTDWKYFLKEIFGTITYKITGKA
jgi:uncharacterized SAM-binding protein YcdF (DUF218 family)